MIYLSITMVYRWYIYILVRGWLTYPSEKYEFASWDDYSHMEKWNSCSKTPNSWDIHCNKKWIQWIIASIIKNGSGKWWFSWTGWIILMGSIPWFRWKMMIRRILKIIGFGGIPFLRRILCRTLPQAWTKQYMLRWDPGSFLEASQDPKKYV